jgi:hypothetical protein
MKTIFKNLIHWVGPVEAVIKIWTRKCQFWTFSLYKCTGKLESMNLRAHEYDFYQQSANIEVLS